MEVHELKEWMDVRLKDLEGKVTVRCTLHQEILKILADRVNNHTKWIASIKGAWAAIVGLGALFVFIADKIWGK